MKNIAAYTVHESPYPEFISVNHDAQTGGVIITVRGPARKHGEHPAAGDMIEIKMSVEEFKRFAFDVSKYEPIGVNDKNQLTLDGFAVS